MDIKEIDVKPLDIIKTLMSLIPKELLPIISQSYDKVVYDLLIGLESNLLGKTFKVTLLQSFNDAIQTESEHFLEKFAVFSNIAENIKYHQYKDKYSVVNDIWFFTDKGEESVVIAVTKQYIELKLLNNKTIKIWKTLKS